MARCRAPRISSSREQGVWLTPLSTSRPMISISESGLRRCAKWGRAVETAASLGLRVLPTEMKSFCMRGDRQILAGRKRKRSENRDQADEKRWRRRRVYYMRVCWRLTVRWTCWTLILTALVFPADLSAQTPNRAQVSEQKIVVARPLPLGAVRLKGGPLKHAQE